MRKKREENETTSNILLSNEKKVKYIHLFITLIQLVFDFKMLFLTLFGDIKVIKVTKLKKQRQRKIKIGFFCYLNQQQNPRENNLYYSGNATIDFSIN